MIPNWNPNQPQKLNNPNVPGGTPSSGVNGPVDITGDTSLNPDNLLTPDALMVYCETRMNGLDTQAQAIFSEQQQNGKTMQVLNDLTATINGYPSGFGVPGATPSDQDPGGAQAALDKCNAAYDAAIAAVGGPNTALGAKLLADKNNILNLDNDTKVSQQEIESMVNNLKGYISDINSGSEMNMIQLQSLMSQRQTAIQLCTNLVQAIGDSPKQIAANMGK